MESAQPLKQRSRIFGVLILLIIIAPMLLAYIMFQTGWGVSGQTTNKGELLTSPVLLQELALQNQGSRLRDLYPASRKRWRLLVPVTATCAEPCAQHLYLTRQVHIRLAEKAYRVERVLLLLGEHSPEAIATLKQEHPESIVVSGSTAALDQWLATNSLPLAPQDYFYLVDQQGYAMMRYGSEHTGQDLLDDIKKLLKFTYDK